MKRTTKWTLSLGLFIAAGLTGTGQTAAAGAPDTGLKITIHVHNYAGVDLNILADAEKTASKIFQKTGVFAVWADASVTTETSQNTPPAQKSTGPSHIQLEILPREMADRLGLPSGVAGLAPGGGADRVLAYVFYKRVQDVAQSQGQPKVKGLTSGLATTQQILAEVIAHEIGHILLNLAVHTTAGIMRGNWDWTDLRDIARGYLDFSKQQGVVIRAEVLRRSMQEASEGPMLASLDSAR